MKWKQVHRKFPQPDRTDRHSAGFPSLFPKTNRWCLPRHTDQPGTSFRGETSDGRQSQILLFKCIRTTRLMPIDTYSGFFLKNVKKSALVSQKSHRHKPESSACSVLCCAAVRMTPLGPLGQSGCAGYPSSPIGPGTAQLPNHGPVLLVS